MPAAKPPTHKPVYATVAMTHDGKRLEVGDRVDEIGLEPFQVSELVRRGEASHDKP